MAPIPESPAEAAGVNPGDELVQIDEWNLEDTERIPITTDEALALLRGPPGTHQHRHRDGTLGTDPPAAASAARGIHRAALGGRSPAGGVRASARVQRCGHADAGRGAARVCGGRRAARRAGPAQLPRRSVSGGDGDGVVLLRRRPGETGVHVGCAGQRARAPRARSVGRLARVGIATAAAPPQPTVCGPLGGAGEPRLGLQQRSVGGGAARQPARPPDRHLDFWQRARPALFPAAGQLGAGAHHRRVPQPAAQPHSRRSGRACR
eukprot:ctg_953.g226